MESEGLARTVELQRRRVQDALGRLDDGTYGRCAVCGGRSTTSASRPARRRRPAASTPTPAGRLSPAGASPAGSAGAFNAASPPCSGVPNTARVTVSTPTLSPGGRKSTTAPRTWSGSIPPSPGLTRRRRGRGFSYHDAAGAPITDPAEVARLKALVIPPAWQDVWISPDPCGHIQAVGTDAAGRRQYRYHDEWRRARDVVKYDRVLTLGAEARRRARRDRPAARRAGPRPRPGARRRRADARHRGVPRRRRAVRAERRRR